MKEERLYQIIKTVMVTEKTSKAAQYNQIGIQVDKKATKDEIKAAVESLLGEKVIAVNTVNQKGKTKRFRNRLGSRKDFKKAYVSLDKAVDMESLLSDQTQA